MDADKRGCGGKAGPLEALLLAIELGWQNAEPMEALLLAIELGWQNAEPIVLDNESGANAFVIPGRDWNAIVDCAAGISTPIVHAQDGSGNVYALQDAKKE